MEKRAHMSYPQALENPPTFVFLLVDVAYLFRRLFGVIMSFPLESKAKIKRECACFLFFTHMGPYFKSG